MKSSRVALVRGLKRLKKCRDEEEELKKFWEELQGKKQDPRRRIMERI